MQQTFSASATLFVLLLGHGLGSAQENVTIVAPTSEAAEGLDLRAVGELFKNSKNLQAFERALNSSGVGVNNLDLDGDGKVDFIRVVEEVTDDAHLIVLQVPLGEDEFQDVATIEVEKTADDAHNMQIRGNEVIYGVNYYVAPAPVHIHTWPIVAWMYRPYYRPYRSVFYFGHYPRWWRPHRPVTLNVYRTRTVRFTRRNTFTVTRTSRVNTVSRVHYRPSSSSLVKKRTSVTRDAPGVRGTKTVTNTTFSKGKTATVRESTKKTTTKKTGKTTVKKGKGGNKTKVKKGRRP